MNESAAPSAVGHVLLKFLQSVGQRSEAEMYLRAFRSLPRGRFAFVVPTRSVLEENLGTVAEQLGFLRDLGLFPSVVLGATEPRDETLRSDLAETLTDLGTDVCRISVDSEQVEGAPMAIEQAEAALAEDRLPIFSIARPGVAGLGALAHRMQPRKIVVLRPEGGIGPQEGRFLEIAPGHRLHMGRTGLGVINLRSDFVDLSDGNFLSDDERGWLRDAKSVLEAVAEHANTKTTLSFASPLFLLRELFTVRGDGTLVKLGATIVDSEDLHAFDRQRLEELLSASFARKLRPEFWQRSFAHLFLEQDYRGVAIVERANHGMFLSKFAVQPLARGEGLGQDLWRALTKRLPRVFWRARPDNPINSWYASVCDGLHRGAEWTVYWRGIAAEDLPAVIVDAERRPVDFQ